MILIKRRVINTKGEASAWESIAPSAFEQANAEYAASMSPAIQEEKKTNDIKEPIPSEAPVEEREIPSIAEEKMNEALLNEWSSPEYWERRIESLEKQREKYNKKPAWSAEDVAEIDRIDKAIHDCDIYIRDLYIHMDEQDRFEYEYD